MQLEAYLHAHIPISAQLGVRVVHGGTDYVKLAAPLGPNLNHQRTGFGGSISAIAILAGWSLLFLRLREHSSGHQIVIQHNTIEYFAPAITDFSATCAAPADAPWQQFMRTFLTRGRGRLELSADVHAEGPAGPRALATFAGRYVALRGTEDMD